MHRVLFPGKQTDFNICDWPSFDTLLQCPWDSLCHFVLIFLGDIVNPNKGFEDHPGVQFSGLNPEGHNSPAGFWHGIAYGCFGSALNRFLIDHLGGFDVHIDIKSFFQHMM